MKDIRDNIFREIRDRSVTAVILADDSGITAGTKMALEKALDLGLNVLHTLEEGRSVHRGDEIARFTGTPKQVAIAEDLLMGCMAKFSGVATAASRFVKASGNNIRIVCGAWKKMPVEIKDALRNAVTAGGADSRICREPFIYLDKNYVRMLGGIKQSLDAVSGFTEYRKVIQIRGIENDIAVEAVEAARCRADIIFVDSGNQEDIKTVSMKLCGNGLRQNVKIAFGGNVKLEDIDRLKTLDVDILDIGREIIDAPMLDLKMEVIDIR
jgi:nicotinate-nucleotide pyrophosphorylase (carboxylating)